MFPPCTNRGDELSHRTLRQNLPVAGIFLAILAIGALGYTATQRGKPSEPDALVPAGPVVSSQVSAPVIVGSYRLPSMPSGMTQVGLVHSDHYTVAESAVAQYVLEMVPAQDDGPLPPATDASGPQGKSVTVTVSETDAALSTKMYEGSVRDYSGTTTTINDQPAFVFSPGPGWKSVMWVHGSDLLQVSGLNLPVSLLEDIAATVSPTI